MVQGREGNRRAEPGEEKQTGFKAWRGVQGRNMEGGEKGVRGHREQGMYGSIPSS